MLTLADRRRLLACASEATRYIIPPEYWRAANQRGGFRLTCSTGCPALPSFNAKSLLARSSDWQTVPPTSTRTILFSGLPPQTVPQRTPPRCVCPTHQHHTLPRLHTGHTGLISQWQLLTDCQQDELMEAAHSHRLNFHGGRIRFEELSPHSVAHLTNARIIPHYYRQRGKNWE